MTFKEHAQIEWDARTEQELREIVRLAIHEDIGGEQDWTTVALVPTSVVAEARIIPRSTGVMAGMKAIESIFDALHYSTCSEIIHRDGSAVSAQTVVAVLKGPAREILTAERIILNTIGRLSGIATMTAKFVKETRGTKAKIYDTRKTTPGWRRLEKYAVRCGGGINHRGGLNEAVMIKDNHVAFGNSSQSTHHFDVATAVDRAREYVATHAKDHPDMIIEIEVDSLEQLQQVLPHQPDIVLLDNMTPSQLKSAVALRDATAGEVQLEASGGVRLDTVAEIAATGVDRISSGALTHSSPQLDVGLDWTVN